MHRRVPGLPRRTGLDVGDTLAVRRNRLVPGHHQPGGVEGGRGVLQHRRRGQGRHHQQGLRGERILHHREQRAIGFGRLDIEAPGAGGAGLRQSEQLALGPTAGFDEEEDGFQLVQQAEQQGAPDPGEALQHPARRRFEQHGEGAIAGQESVQPDGDHGIGGEHPLAHGPWRPRADGQPATIVPIAGVGREVELPLRPGTVAGKHPGIVEVDRIHEQQPVAVAIVPAAGRHAGRVHLEQRLARRCAPLPEADGAGVSRLRRPLPGR